MKIQNDIDNIDKKYSKMVVYLKERYNYFKRYLSNIIDDRVHITTGKDTHFANTISVFYVIITAIITCYLYISVFFTPDGLCKNILMYFFENFNNFFASASSIVAGAFMVVFTLCFPFVIYFSLPIIVELFITYYSRHKTAFLLILIISLILL